MNNLQKEFEEETGLNWLNGDGEPEIDYVAWLEDRVIGYRGLIEAIEKQNAVKERL